MFDFDENSLIEWKKRIIKQIFVSTNAGVSLEIVSTVEGIDAASKEDLLDIFGRIAKISLDNLSRVTSDADKILWGKIFYVCTREFGVGWTEFLRLLPQCNASNTALNYPIELPEKYNVSAIPPQIFQCRPDKPKFTSEVCEKVTWYQKNPDFAYRCLNDESALTYLSDNLGPRFVEAYHRVGYPAGRADLMALSFLYWEGGVFADVFSACRASISNLLGSNNGLVLFVNGSRVEKFFIAATPRHPHIERFLKRVIKLTEYGMRNTSHDKFTDHLAFTLSIIDAYCENPAYFKENKISFIQRETYGCFVDFNGQDEDLASQITTDYFKTIPISGLIPREERLDLFSCAGQNTVLGAVEAQILPAGIPLTVVGHNPHPDWSERQKRSAISPAAHVYDLNMVGLSGHCGLWKDDTFIQLDSYLSHVGEMESRSGHWRPPTRSSITRVVDEPVIPAFSAGYGCYGHYIVDDLPRLGLIRKTIGDAEFRKLKIIMPRKTPRWAFDLLEVFFGIDQSRIVLFDHENDLWILRRAVVSEYMHRNYVFNPYIKEFYQSYVTEDIAPTRKICLSRRAWEPGKSHQRIFEQQDWFENEAERRGFEIISPEKLSIPDQIRLMCETKVQIGEHGSAQHASIYSKFGMTVGTVNPLGDVQINLGRLSGNKNVIIYETGNYKDDNQNTFYRCDQGDLVKFFDALD